MRPELLRTAFARQMSPDWHVSITGTELVVEHDHSREAYHPPRRHVPWAELLNRLDEAFGEVGVRSARPLPLRWGHETELTISAVQAADPYLKWGRALPYRSGYIPQPVVRTTARRTGNGHLTDGFVTSFVNISRVEPITSADDVALVFDQWLTVLSRIGLNARHIRLHGDLKVWRRREVKGVTLRFSHAGMELGDIVILQSVEQPERLVVDLGTGLERIAWVRSRRPWTTLIHETEVAPAVADHLDALRTAVLLVGSGITPSGRGAGSITRRFLSRLGRPEAIRCTPPDIQSRARLMYRFWDLTGAMRIPWTVVDDLIARATRDQPLDRLGSSRRVERAPQG